MGEYKENSLSLIGAIGLGTGVMISAGIFALLGQVAELAGTWFPLMFIAGGIVTGFSAYSYVKMSNEYPSAGGIGMFLVKAYGKGTLTASAAMLMAVSMVINQSLVARTFGTYTLQIFNVDEGSFLVPVLGVGLLLFAFIVNISGNSFIQTFTSVISLLKIIGLVVFAMGGLWVVGFSVAPAEGGSGTPESTVASMIAAIALTILSFKGFTTITNSGSEIVKPKKNVGRAIIITILITLVVYLLVAWVVSSNLSLSNIIEAKNYSLAEAARPAFGDYGVWFTVAIAIVATISGIIASVFAVSRMLAMLTDMKLIPHKHFGMPGRIQKHTLVYTIVLAMFLAVVFDLTRIASVGAILYLVMDMMVHWGVFKHLRKKVNANPGIVLTAFCLDGIVLTAFTWVKLKNDWLIVAVSLLFIVFIFIGEHFFLKNKSEE
ncbi:amino acid/polyamine/organocation transporter, APC superfamily (TC 2.A.3) [Halobacillus dabanensis]|uniref:Amino acid/polyamine/organocation transporter, APC superfamily (TC 2.A.3) n=1 Tax=Halobacillus dabanensis TaxID=240302 RepID=A0A1I3UUJ8_HALDA|nr:APC family permease [Halobacillus dabanensis]SFJ86868.1 amino acid/polyamine/organocation transporter, APC superfamily (TC 2.A.3) [Halobacillus dabanensis]